MKRLGVIGTMVWDTIHRGPRQAPIEEWGGVAYSLAALEAALPTEWVIVPLIKVGRDLAPQANIFLGALTRRAGAARFIEVAEPNNRVTLRYDGLDRMSECLRGGVPGWTWSELGPMVRDLDALYVNFISGFELDLATATRLRRGFGGPVYADLHSLFLGLAPDGARIPQPLARVAEWFACFDVVQLNEDELALIGGEPMEVAAQAAAQGVRLLVVTLGPRGAVYFAGPGFRLSRGQGGAPVAAGPVQTARVAGVADAEARDPTGCGDVFGGTLVAELLQGRDVETAIRTANVRAARNAAYHGATHLQYHLRGEIVPR